MSSCLVCLNPSSHTISASTDQWHALLSVAPSEPPTPSSSGPICDSCLASIVRLVDLERELRQIRDSLTFLHRRARNTSFVTPLDVDQDFSGDVQPTLVVASGLPFAAPSDSDMEKLPFSEDSLLLQREMISASDKFPQDEGCCQYCGKQLKTRAHFLNHECLPTVQTKQHECSTCSKRFSHKYYLNEHVKQVHMGRSMHTCDTCGKTFQRLLHLQNHARIHSGERPHVCGVCGRAFSQLSNL